MSMFTLTAIWLLLLGSRDLRRYIDKRAMEILPFQRFSHIVYLRCAVGIAGSLLLQIGFTIWTARIFAYGQSYVELESIAMGWFLRPLPALPCLLVIAFDGKRFNETFQEMLVVESFLTLIPLAQMWHIVLACHHSPPARRPIFQAPPTTDLVLGCFSLVLDLRLWCGFMFLR